LGKEPMELLKETKQKAFFSIPIRGLYYKNFEDSNFCRIAIS